MMAGTWTFGRRIGLGFLVAGVVLLLIAVFGYQNAHGLIENARWVSHTQEVRREITELSAHVKDIESSVRGFVLTGKDEFLAPYTVASTDVEKTYSALRGLMNDNPEQLRRLDVLRPVLDRKLAVSKKYIELRRGQGFEPAQTALAQGEGDHIMQDIRHAVQAMDNEETRLYEQRRRASEAAAETTKSVIAWGSAAGIVFVAVVGYLIAQALARQVGSAVRHIQSSSTELQAAANQQATGAKEQATAMSEITTTISELLATSRQIAESSQRVATIASETRAAAQSGDQLLQRTNDSIGGMRRQIELVVSHMLDLGKKSQEIGGILEIINELSEQTNILAINATIEAAGAGEAGRRFAVVADEVRRLADRVGGSAKEIRELIDEIRAAVNTTVMATEGGTKAVDAGARLFSDAAQAFAQIVGLVGTTSEAAREIELSTKQQSTAVEQVNQAAASVAQATKENEASSSQTLQTASQLATLSRDLLKVIQSQAAA
ncbi:MAG: methyl-accepting chemotaxis protein [Myxococcota bacterium]